MSSLTTRSAMIAIRGETGNRQSMDRAAKKSKPHDGEIVKYLRV